MPIETPLGDGLYLDTRCDSYVWRGRLNGKSARKVIRHDATNAVATTSNMTKTEARRIAKAMTADAANGVGAFFPVAQMGGVTVREAWSLYWEREGSKQRTAREKQSQWTNHIEPTLGDKLLSALTRKDCAAIIDRVLTTARANGQNGNAALNLQKNMKRFFNWCADAGYGGTGLEASPMAAMKERPIDVKLTQRRSRALNEQELVWLFKALEHFATTVGRRQTAERKRRTAEAVETLLRSMCRRADIYGARWGWLRSDGLHIPRTKMDYALLLPLTPCMRALIGDRPDDAEDGDFIFGAGVTWLARAIEEVRKTMTQIAREEGSNADFHTAKVGDEHNPDYWTGHDFRDTGKRLLGIPERADDGMKKFPPEVREAMLNHREKGVAAIYNSELELEDYMLAQRRIAGAYLDGVYDALKAKALQPEAHAA